MRFGAFLLDMLHFGHHLAALAFELRDFLLSGDERFLRLGDALAQFGQRFLLELELGVIGYRQRLALLVQAIAPAGNDLQRALRVATIRDLDLQTLIGLGQRGALLVDLLLRAGMSLLDDGQTFLLRGKPHLALFDALISQHGQFLPAFTVGIKLLDLTLPMYLVVGELRQTRLVFLL